MGIIIEANSGIVGSMTRVATCKRAWNGACQIVGAQAMWAVCVCVCVPGVPRIHLTHIGGVL